MGELPSLTGNQVWCVRCALRETQTEFAKRFFMHQVFAHRLEERRERTIKERDASEVLRIAKDEGIAVPDPSEANERRRKHDSDQVKSA